MTYTILLIVFGVLLALLITIDYRDTWNPPIKGRGTPKILNHRKSAPYSTQGRPTILNPKWAPPHVEEEVEEFNDFINDIRGSANTTTGKVPIRHCKGVLTSWSYKPFREGHWRDFVTSGLTDPKFLHWFGRESMIPNPNNNMIESPLTLVNSEEDILRILGGSVKVRIFTSYQPTFPKFTIDEHGDSLVGPFNHKIKGEEFMATDGMILAIPRGWAYRLQLDENCKGVIRIPVHNPLSWSSNSIHQIRSSFSPNTRPKHNKPYSTYGSNRPIEDTSSEGGSVSDTDSES
jgi:hypothetical protein